MKAIDVKVPDSVSLVIANSLTPSPKLLTIGTRYNKRVVECRLALYLICLKLGEVSSVEDIKIKTFYELQTKLGKTYQEMLEIVDSTLSKGGYNH